MTEWGVVARPAERDDGASRACTALGGLLEPSGTCVLDRIQGGRLEPCLRNCSQCVASDDYGPCYAFQRLPDGSTRARYRTDGACLANFEAFQNDCVATCANADRWGKDAGEYVAPLTPQDTCALNTAAEPCGAAGCHWADDSASRRVMCDAWPGAPRLHPDECATLCYASGGAPRDGGCDLPQCAPFL
jgi:hypothetical protein